MRRARSAKNKSAARQRTNRFVASAESVLFENPQLGRRPKVNCIGQAVAGQKKVYSIAASSVSRIVQIAWLDLSELGEMNAKVLPIKKREWVVIGYEQPERGEGSPGKDWRDVSIWFIYSFAPFDSAAISALSKPGMFRERPAESSLVVCELHLIFAIR